MIENLKYVGRKGSIASIGLGVNTSQFDDIENGLLVHNEGPKSVLWQSNNNRQVEFSVTHGCLFAYPTPDMSKIVVIYSDEEVTDPNNAVVLNEDGTRVCQLMMPKRLSTQAGRRLPRGELTGFMQCGWSSNPDYMEVDCYIADSDFIERRLLRMFDFQFDESYFRTWRL